MRIQFLAAAALGVSLAGCAVGPRVENFKPAQQPSGVEATLNLNGETTLKAELLEVQETGLVVLHEREVMLIPYTIIRRGKFLQTGISIRAGNPPRATAREQLRLFSRFPQGLSPALLDSLLSAYRQEKLTVGRDKASLMSDRLRRSRAELFCGVPSTVLGRHQVREITARANYN